MKIDKIVEGSHNGRHFKLTKGKLEMFGFTWDRNDLKTLIETANLLEIEGYKIKTPTGSRKEMKQSLFGGEYETEVKEYEDD